MEEVGHVKLNDDHIKYISRMKTLHTIVIAVAIPGATILFYVTKSSGAYMLPLMGAMWLCQVLDVLFGRRQLNLKDLLVGIVQATLCAMSGMMVFVIAQGLV